MTMPARTEEQELDGIGPWTDGDTQRLLLVKREFLFEHNQLIAMKIRMLKQHLEGCARTVAAGPEMPQRAAFAGDMLSALQIVDDLLDELDRQPD